MSVLFLQENKEKFDSLDKTIEENKDKKGSLMPIMQDAQSIFGYLPFEVQEYISKELDLPLPDVYGVATFYSQFSLEKKGEHVISVCQGTACYVKGSKKIQEELEKELDIKAGETTNGGKFTLVETRCVGACGLAPIIMIDEDAHGKLVPKKMKAVVDKYKDK